jgi:RNA polymerase sigma factor (sigma-70 family)
MESSAAAAGTILSAGGGDLLESEADAFGASLVSVISHAVRLARAIGLNGDDAADVVQDAVVSAWRHRKQLRGRLEPWFLSIVRRRAGRHRRWMTVPVFWGAAAREEWPDLDGLDPRLATALKALPVRQRLVLWLRYGLDMSTADTAQVLGTSEAAAKQLCLRARATVQARMTSGERDG